LIVGREGCQRDVDEETVEGDSRLRMEDLVCWMDGWMDGWNQDEKWEFDRQRVKRLRVDYESNARLLVLAHSNSSKSK
jgi:hypothetical protein